MNKPLTLTFLTIGLFACNERPTEGSKNLPVSEVQETERYSSVHLQYNTPMVLDSSDWVLYPLRLEESEETEKGLKSSEYGRQSAYAYWNIAFFNTETKETRLLSDSLKMLINAIHTEDEDGESGLQNDNNDRRIYYSITKTDYNQDEKLNSDDPVYLFVSDPSGQNFKQVSPDNLNLIHWENVYRTNKILIQVHNDSNNDKKFNDDDEIVSFVYDREEQKIEQVFDSAFNLKTKKLLDHQWTKKK